MRLRSVFVAVTAWAAVAVMPINMVVAQMSKEWSQCSGAEGAIADVIISGCSTVIQAGQGSPKQLATAFNNRGVVYKFKGEYDRALEDYNQAILRNPSYANAYNNRGVIYRLKVYYDRAIAYTEKQDYDRAIADFEMVLRFNAKNALALYGRGAARLKKGDSQTGSADIADAKAINPNVAEEFEHSAKR